MIDLEEIKRRANIIELFPELEITLDKIKQASTNFLEKQQAEFKKVIDIINNIYMPPAVPWPFEPEVRVQVPKNTNMTITEQFVSRDCFANLEYICVLIPQRNCAFTIYIDGQVFGAFMTSHQLGTIENPMKLDPAIEVNTSIRIIGYNTDLVNNHCFRIILRGKEYIDPAKNEAPWRKTY